MIWQKGVQKQLPVLWGWLHSLLLASLLTAHWCAQDRLSLRTSFKAPTTGKNPPLPLCSQKHIPTSLLILLSQMWGGGG